MVEFSKQSEELAQKPEEVEPAGELAPQQDEDTAETKAPSELTPELEKKEEVELSEPSKKLATKILSEAGFKERLLGVKSHPMVGDTAESLYSVKEAANFLHFDAGDLRIKGSGSIGYIDLDELQKWVRDVFGDEELAEAIGKKIKEGKNYKEQMTLIKPLLEQRLKQCREVVGEEAEA